MKLYTQSWVGVFFRGSNYNFGTDSSISPCAYDQNRNEEDHLLQQKKIRQVRRATRRTEPMTVIAIVAVSPRPWPWPLNFWFSKGFKGYRMSCYHLTCCSVEARTLKHCLFSVMLAWLKYNSDSLINDDLQISTSSLFLKSIPSQLQHCIARGKKVNGWTNIYFFKLMFWNQ